MSGSFGRFADTTRGSCWWRQTAFLCAALTDDLIAETQRVWSPYYGHDLSTEEAVEILRNVKRFAEVLVTRQREGGNQ